jgi:YVTN family beta-propeller protein
MDSNEISLISVSAQKLVGRVPLKSSPHGIQVAPDGKLVWVTLLHLDTVIAVDTTTRKVVAEVKVEMEPYYLVVDSRYVWVSNQASDSVSVIDAAQKKLVTSIPVGQEPHGLAFTPDGRYLWVAHRRQGMISVISVEKRAVVAEVKVGKRPHKLGIVLQAKEAVVKR